MSNTTDHHLKALRSDPCTNEVLAFTESGEAVMERRTCPLYEDCKTFKLACESFLQYVKSGHCYDPRSIIPVRTVRVKHEPPMRNHIKATSELYKRMITEGT